MQSVDLLNVSVGSVTGLISFKHDVERQDLVAQEVFQVANRRDERGPWSGCLSVMQHFRRERSCKRNFTEFFPKSFMRNRLKHDGNCRWCCSCYIGRILGQDTSERQCKADVWGLTRNETCLLGNVPAYCHVTQRCMPWRYSLIDKSSGYNPLVKLCCKVDLLSIQLCKSSYSNSVVDDKSYCTTCVSRHCMGNYVVLIVIQ